MKRLVDELATYLEASGYERAPVVPLTLAEDAILDDGLSTLTGQEVARFLEDCPSDVSMLLRSSDDTSMSLLFEHVDEVSGLAVRQAWVIELAHGDLVSRILICRGLSTPLEAPVNDTLRIFGFGPLSKEQDEAEVASKVREAVLRTTGHNEPHFSSEALLANKDLVYVPSSGIGSAGLLVSRSTWRATQLGSAISPAAHVWAHYKGFADGETSANRSNDLVILKAADISEAERALREIFSGKYYWNEIHPKLHDLPLRVRGVDLYFAREQLFRAELCGWLEFRVEAPT